MKSKIDNSVIVCTGDDVFQMLGSFQGIIKVLWSIVTKP